MLISLCSKTAVCLWAGSGLHTPIALLSTFAYHVVGGISLILPGDPIPTLLAGTDLKIAVISAPGQFRGDIWRVPVGDVNLPGHTTESARQAGRL